MKKLILLLILFVSPCYAQDVIPTSDNTYSIGEYNYRYKSIWVNHVSVGNPSDSHGNVLFKIGCGQLICWDTLVGSGSSFTSVYATNSAPTFKSVGNGTGDIFGHDESLVLISDGNVHTMSNTWMHTITLPAISAIDSLLVVPNLRGLVLTGYSTSVGAGYAYYPQPNNVVNSSIFWIKSGLSIIDDVMLVRNTEIQLANGSALRSNGIRGLTLICSSGQFLHVTDIEGGIPVAGYCS